MAVHVEGLILTVTHVSIKKKQDKKKKMLFVQENEQALWVRRRRE